MQKFIVMEIQTFENGSLSTPAYAYGAEGPALAKYYTLCAGAAVSALPVHTVILMTNDGFGLKKECFRHEPGPAEEA